uniref:Uncharacterized protein n=1 Tax=Tanacetum cinerariifolium TaxID=118510 RepID=A0A6L2LM84_TANCI|nr:hypothetical protein [Tanacetum cinerariifolium]
MYLFAFIRHSDPTKVRIGERELTEREVGLLKMTKGCSVPLSPLATTAPEESCDRIKKLFDDADPEHTGEVSGSILLAFPFLLYDPSAEEKYVDAVNAFGAVDFSLLSELESKKDSSIVDLIDSLYLEGALAEIL